MKTAKNIKSFSFFLLLCCSILAVVGTVVAAAYYIYYSIVNYVDYEYCETAKTYLEEKYNKSVIIDDYIQNYCGIPAVYFHFVNDTVQYVSFTDYDYYLSSCLETEAESIILKRCSDFLNVKEVLCDLHSSADGRLALFYEQNGRPPTWGDKCQENITNVRIYYFSKKIFSDEEILEISKSIVSCWDDMTTFEDCLITFLDNSSGKTYRFKVEEGTVKQRLT